MTAPVSTTIPLTVKVGPATRLQSQMQAGTMLINTDPKNAVWVSENASVVPGYGYKLAANGSLVWQNAGSECWAVVDTGVTSPVPIVIGNSISDLQDPVSVGVAVATEITAQGLPLVFVSEYVADEVIPAVTTKTYDVSKYASLIISADGTFLPVALNLTWHGDLVNHSFSPPELNDVMYSGTNLITGVQINVRAQSLDIQNLQGDCHIQIIGTNRLLPRPIDTRINAETMSKHTVTQTFIANSGVALTDTGVGQKQGLVQAEFTITNTTVKGVFFLQTANSTGVWADSLRVTDSNEMHAAPDNQWSISKQIIVPSCQYRFTFRPSIGGAATVNVNLLGGDM